MDVTRTFDILERLKHLFPNDHYLGGKSKGKWETLSTIEYYQLAHTFSLGLLASGLDEGDKIATISNNRPEWNIIDMGMAQAGIVHVPIYPTISRDDYKYILNHCKPKMIILSDKSLLEKLKPVVEKTPSIKEIVTFAKLENTTHWKRILDRGSKNEKKYDSDLQIIKKKIKEDDMVTLIYTSGTTGFPKGVMLSHKNILSNTIATSKRCELGASHKVLSFLPLCHIYERMMNYHFQYKGQPIFYAENMGTIIENIKEIKPDIFNSVPRLLERVYDKIVSKGKELSGLKKIIFNWALNLGLRYEPKKKYGWFFRTQLKYARKLVFSKWQDALGGNLKIIVSGGAALQPRLGRIFNAAGIEVLEGYGLTETSPVIAVSNQVKKEFKIGTVGPPLEGVNVKIAEDGEILCKGPNVMLGYYKQPELTKKVIDKEGWFHTGDIGILDEGKYLKITDRKKSIFKLNSGKYVAPQAIENKFKESIFIDQAMVIGENEKFASALISPNFEYLHGWAFQNKIHFRDNKELIKTPEIINLFQQEVSRMNQSLGQVEQIKRFRLVPEEWNLQNKMLSPTLKLKRIAISEFYVKTIEEIYAPQKNEVLDEVKIT